jgi:hypothetical protein
MEAFPGRLLAAHGSNAYHPLVSAVRPRTHIRKEDNMSEPSALTIASFVILIATFVITEKVKGIRVGEAVCQIVQELNEAEAYDPFTAVELPSARIDFFRVGFRNFRPSAVDILTQRHIVARTGTGKLYLKMRAQDERVQRILGACAMAP